MSTGDDATRGPLLPLYGFLEGDTLGLLVLAYAGETVAELAAKVERSARIRVAPRAGLQVVHQGRALDPGLTLEAAGIEALDRVDVRERGIR